MTATSRKPADPFLDNFLAKYGMRSGSPEFSELLREMRAAILAEQAATQLLTIGETAERLGVRSDRTVYALITAGKLRAVDIRGPGSKRSKTRIREDDLQDYIDSVTRDARAVS